jgi:hypothetical protein
MTWPKLPRAALVVIVVGLALSALAHLLETETTGADEINYEADRVIPSASTATAAGKLQITDAQIATTRANASGGGYRLFRVSAVFRMAPPPGAAAREARCTIRVPGSAIVARTPDRRASYPRPSDKFQLAEQPVPATVVIEFSTAGKARVAAELDDALGRFIHGGHATLEWGEYRPAAQTWLWKLQARPGEPLSLGFASYWRTEQEQEARIVCSASTGADQGRVRASGRLDLSGVG